MKPKKGKKASKRPRSGTDDGSDESDIEIVADSTDQTKLSTPGFPSRHEDNYASDVELDTRKLVTKQNRKKKKSGGFQSMGLCLNVLRGVLKKGYKVPTPIQRKCIPVIMDGKDVVAMARTGSGKTAAFLTPMFEKLQTHSAKSGARAMILSPTRELALQTLKFTKELGKYTNLRSAVVLGGDRMEDQFAALHENPDIIIATPGRFLHVVVEMELKLDSIQYVVFDEADRLFEMGFSEQLREIIQRLPDDRQTLLFSATLPKLLIEFARAGLNDPTLIRLDVDTKLSAQLKLSFFSVRADDKVAALLHLLTDIIKPTEQTVVFLATKHHVEFIKEILSMAGIDCCYIYSSLDQAARKINIAKFGRKKSMVMLVTDVAARGIDIPMLDNVINYHFPAKPKLFVHRVGRVARAGRSGTAYSLVSSDELPYLLDLHLFLGRSLTYASHTTKQDTDGILGRVPQTVIDDQDSTVESLLEKSQDLQNLKRVSDNAYKHYLKSRPAAAPESIKRMKEIDFGKMSLHPIFGAYANALEIDRARMVDDIKNYKPCHTVLEVNSTAKSQRFEVMKAKRSVHTNAIRKFQLKKEEKSANDNAMHAAEIQSTVEMSTDKDIESAFSTVVAPGHKRKQRDGDSDGKRKKLKQASTSIRDEEYFINYRAPDHHAEKGLSIAESSFDQQASLAMLDLTGDDADTVKQQKNYLKWDRKKKKFIREGGDEKKKKIKTESGTYIQASFKKNIYKDWLEKSKVGERDSDDHDSEEENSKRHQGRWKGRGRHGNMKPKEPFKKGKQGKRGRKRGKGQQPAQGAVQGKKARSEMKNKDQILKARKVAAKKHFAQQQRQRKIMNKRKGGAGGKRNFGKKR
ncbi:ATP-dependent RNA helicase DDX54-like [Ptychodera flava]|uniref:ATP-dependent RNA helicase DDX54-like n=1 Tax=Ptychodera flava TaxID=63121 RepID=UPI003969E7C0